MFSFNFNFFKKKDSQLWRVKHNAKWKRIRQLVLKRDKYTCQHCNKKQTKLRRMAVHHINDASSNPKLIFRLNNLITLCHGKGKCHNKFHKWNGGFHVPCNARLLDRWMKYDKQDNKVMIWVMNNVLVITAIFLTLTIIIPIIVVALINQQ